MKKQIFSVTVIAICLLSSCAQTPENICFFILVHLKSKSFSFSFHNTPPAGGWLRQELPVSLRRIASC